MLSRLVHCLKGGKSGRAWQYYANQFWKQHPLEAESKTIFIPAPPSKLGKRDHAYFWGESLSREYGGEFMPILQKESPLKMQKLGRGERALVSISCPEISTIHRQYLAKNRVIFVDDIITTGATARAAYEALNYPSHFEVWTLAHRTFSCGAARDLL